MKHFVIERLKSTPVYAALRRWAAANRQKRVVEEWEARGRPVPPPHVVKQRTIREFAQRYDLRILVETGTFQGDMVAAMKPYFDQIYSIELSHELHEKAKRRFAGDERIRLIQGDSGVELGTLLELIDRPALFWLDGHYSGDDTAKGEKETPIFEELSHILRSQPRGHVIVVDDARMFGRDPAYPSVEQLSDFVRAIRPEVSIDVENDSIRIVPPDRHG